MPGLYKFTATTYPNGVVSIHVDDRGENYRAVQASFVSHQYRMANYYCQAQNQQQLLKPLEFQKYDANGNRLGYPLMVTMNPNQFQNVVVYDFGEHPIALDGQYFWYYEMLPLESVKLVLYVRELSLGLLLPDQGRLDLIFGQFKDRI